jgi:hypothetical protein
MKSTPALPHSIESSLTEKFESLSIHDNISASEGCRVASDHAPKAALYSDHLLLVGVTRRPKRVKLREPLSGSMET